jgi:hypothetical protein
MSLLASLFSTIDSAKRKAADVVSSPYQSLMQMVGDVNDRARTFNELNDAALAEGMASGRINMNAPATGQLAQTLADAYGPAAVGMFVGKGSKTWDKAAAEQAQKMAAKGVDPRQIWKETGTFKGPDGMWRQEIPDNTSKLTLDRVLPDSYGAQEANLFEGAVKHQRLKRAYPELNETKMMHWPEEAYKGANYSSFDDTITMGKSAMKDPTRVDLHEIQHVIQGREGFAKGGSPQLMRMAGEEAVDPRFIEGLKKWNKTLESEGYPKDKLFQPNDVKMNDPDQLWDWIQRQGGWLETKRGKYAPEFDAAFPSGVSPMVIDANEAYRRLAGEAEARATQARRSLNAAQRRELFPLDSYDVPVDQLIIRGVMDTLGQ